MRPVAERPYIAHKEYGIPDDLDHLVDWSHVVGRFTKEQNYWIGTASLDLFRGRPQDEVVAQPRIQPEAWTEFPKDMTRFRFE